MRFEQGYALIVGVGSYAYVSHANIPISVADAMQMKEVLSNPDLCGYPQDQVYLLHDDSATREGILQVLDELASKTKPHDTIVFYYCGHGEYGSDGTYYLTTHDTKLDGEKVAYGTGISEEDLLGRLRRLNTQRLLFVCNACYSGVISPNLSLVETESDNSFNTVGLPIKTADAILASGEGRILITASRPEQKSWVGSGTLSIFTQAIVDGLSGNGKIRNNGSYISAFGLYEYVFEEVKTAANKLGKVQEPELTVLKGVGPFPIALYHGPKKSDFYDINEPLPVGTAIRIALDQAQKEHTQAALRSYVERITDYCNRVPYKALERQLQNSNGRTLAEVYIPLLARGIVERGSIVQSIHTLPISEVLKSFVESKGIKPLCILGVAGAGKSSLLRHIAKKSFHDPGSVGLNRPFLVMPINLNSLYCAEGSDVETRLLGALYKNSELQLESRPPDGFFSAWPGYARSPWLLLLDGLDEVPEDARVELLEWIYEFNSRLQAHEGRVIITTRPIEALDIELHKHFDVFDICPLSDTQKNEFAIGILGDKADRFLSQFRSMEDEYFLRTPLLFAISCIIYTQRNEIPKSRSDLYRQYIEVMMPQALQRGATEMISTETGKKGTVIRQIVDDVICRVAFQSTLNHVSSNSGQPVRADVESEVERFLVEKDITTSYQAQGSSKKILSILGEHSGIFVLTRDSLEWVHPSFREFLTASFMNESLKENSEVLGAFLESQPLSDRWNEPLNMLLEIANQDVSKLLIDGLLDAAKDEHEPIKVVSLGRYLLQSKCNNDLQLRLKCQILLLNILPLPLTGRQIRKEIKGRSETKSSAMLSSIYKIKLFRVASSRLVQRLTAKQKRNSWKFEQDLDRFNQRYLFNIIYLLGDVGDVNSITYLVRILLSILITGRMVNYGIFLALTCAQMIQKIASRIPKDAPLQSSWHQEETVWLLSLALPIEQVFIGRDCAYALQNFGLIPEKIIISDWTTRTDEITKVNSIIALQKIHSSRILHKLVQVLGSKQALAVQTAMQSIANYGGEAVPLLVSLAQGGDRDTAENAITALGFIKGEGWEALLKLCQSDVADIKRAAWSALGSNMSDSSLFDIIVSLLPTLKPDYRQVILFSFLYEGEPPIEYFERHLLDGGSEVRRFIAGVLARSFRKDAQQVLLRYLGMLNPRDACDIAIVLAENQSDTYRSWLRSFLFGKSVRLSCIAALSLRFDTEKGQELLEKVLPIAESETRVCAAESLGYMNNLESLDILKNTQNHVPADSKDWSVLQTSINTILEYFLSLGESLRSDLLKKLQIHNPLSPWYLGLTGYHLAIENAQMEKTINVLNQAISMRPSWRWLRRELAAELFISNRIVDIPAVIDAAYLQRTDEPALLLHSIVERANKSSGWLNSWMLPDIHAGWLVHAAESLLPLLRSEMSSAIELALSIDDSWLQFMKALALLEQNERYTEAFESITLSLKHSDNNSLAVCVKALLLQRLDQWEDAIECVRSLMTTNPDHIDALCAYSSILFDQGNNEDAVLAIDKAIQLAPSNVTIWRKKIRLSLLLVGPQLAYELLNMASEACYGDDQRRGTFRKPLAEEKAFIDSYKEGSHHHNI